jgi:hypothetical protein
MDLLATVQINPRCTIRYGLDSCEIDTSDMRWIVYCNLYLLFSIGAFYLIRRLYHFIKLLKHESKTCSFIHSTNFNVNIMILFNDFDLLKSFCDGNNI